MNKTRFSKLQKWILEQCYTKTILFDNSHLDILQNWESKSDELAISDKTNLYWQYLFRSEILLTYFKCKTDYDKYPFQRFHHFQERNNKQQVTLTRSLQNLRDTEFISIWDGVHSRWQGIKLKEKGIEKAKNILNVNT